MANGRSGTGCAHFSLSKTKGSSAVAPSMNVPARHADIAGPGTAIPVGGLRAAMDGTRQGRSGVGERLPGVEEGFPVHVLMKDRQQDEVGFLVGLGPRSSTSSTRS